MLLNPYPFNRKQSFWPLGTKILFPCVPESADGCNCSLYPVFIKFACFIPADHKTDQKYNRNMLATKSYKLLSRTPVLATRMAPRVIATRNFGIGDQLGQKVRAYHDLFGCINGTNPTPLFRNVSRFSFRRLFMNIQEKVEEDRYMRDLERQYVEKKKAEMAEKMAAEEEEKFKDVIAPAMAEAEVLLSKTGDSVSHDALENLAKWKAGV